MGRVRMYAAPARPMTSPHVAQIPFQPTMPFDPKPMGLQTPQDSSGPNQNRFDPYQNNGGSVCAIARDDYCVIAGDTRMVKGYGIASRGLQRIFQLTDQCVLATSGLQADGDYLVKLMRTRLKMYKHQNGADMSTEAIAHMLSTILYSRRFFPLYTFNIIGGMDSNGKGALFTYDAIGSYERSPSSALGSASAHVAPMLDCEADYKHQSDAATKGPLGVDRAAELIRDGLTSAAERDVNTGDGAIMFIITAAGIKEERSLFAQIRPMCVPNACTMQCASVPHHAY